MVTVNADPDEIKLDDDDDDPQKVTRLDVEGAAMFPSDAMRNLYG